MVAAIVSVCCADAKRIDEEKAVVIMVMTTDQCVQQCRNYVLTAVNF